MKKTDHCLALIKAGLALTPYVGGPIASLIGDYIPTATERSVNRALELLGKRLKELEHRIDVEAVNKDDFAELFKSCYLSIVRSHRDNKLRAATAIIANLLLREGDPEKLTYTELDHFARCVETLSSGAVEVLGSIVNTAQLEENLELKTNSYRMSFGDIRKQFPKHSPDLLMGLILELDKVNLLRCRDVPPIKMPNYLNYPVNLTQLGMRFAKFLLE